MIKDVVNEYAVVTRIINESETDRDSVIVPGAASIWDGTDEFEIALFIQMKGSAVHDEYNQPIKDLWGEDKQMYNTGIYSLMLVERVVNDSIVIFSSTLREDLDVPFVQPDTIPLTAQLVKVPYGESFELEGDLGADPWDPVTRTGGVLALFAAKKLDLAGFNIDVSSMGFLGGDTARSSPGITDCGGRDGSSRPITDDNIAGMKGGSIVYDGYPYVRGNAFVLGGGGGGEGRWTGGGGGSNASAGGRGGFQSPDFCPPSTQFVGRSGTILITNFNNDMNRIFLGGGGGSSVPEPGLSATPGGNGGGIVIIITDTLAAGPTGSDIRASGGSVTDTSFTGGGGGGAGGFIVLDINEVVGDVNLEATGGAGGHTFDETVFQYHGPGGGGSGGVIWHNESNLLPGLTDNLGGGDKGLHLPVDGNRGTGDGTDGIVLSDLILPLRGFFFNFLSGSQDICQDSVPNPILGSIPKGDTLFIFSWQDSTNGVQPSIIPGAVSKDYAPPIISETTWYRRIVTKTTPPIESDTSEWIEKTFFPEIQNNLIAPDDTVCYDLKPDPMVFTGGSLTGGNGTYDYIWWARNHDQAQWIRAASLADDGNDEGEGFQAGEMQDTTFFKRQVISHVCQHTSDELLVVVLPSIEENEVEGTDTVCQHYAANDLTGSVPRAGDIGKYQYNWEARTEATSWASVASSQNFSPGAMDGVTTWYRRIVYSGKEQTCRDISDSIIVVVHPKIQQNIIAPDTAVCAETPTNLVYPSAGITGGDDIYRYTFYSSHDSVLWTVARPESPESSYNPVELDRTTWYFRSVVSGMCTDSSEAVKFHVDTVILNNLLFAQDDTICQGTGITGVSASMPGGGTGSYGYLWDRSTDLQGWTQGFETLQDLGPQTLFDSTWFRRRVTSGVCIDTSAVAAVYVHDTITGNLIWMDTVLAKDACVLLPKIVRGQNESEGLAGGTGNPADIRYAWEKFDGAVWITAPSGGSLQNDRSNYETENLTGAQYTYRRKIEWGMCSDISDPETLTVKPRPLGSITPTPVDSACYDGENQIQIVVPVGFDVGLKPFTVYYSDGQGGSGSAIMDTYSGDFSIYVGTNDSTLYSVIIDSIIDAYGCLDTMLLASKGMKQGMIYSGLPPELVQDTFRVCGDEAAIEVNEGIGRRRYWGPMHDDYTITPVDEPQASFRLAGWTNDTLFFPVTWYQRNGVCPRDSVKLTVELYQPPPPARVHPADSTVYFRQRIPLWADTSVVGLGTWSWVGDHTWETGDGGDPIKDIHSSGAWIDLGIDDLDKEVVRQLSWSVRNGECPTDSVNVNITRRDLVLYTAFSPNADPWNEYLILDGLEFADEFTMKIYSRQMVLVKTITQDDVFEDTRSGLMNAVWDGKLEDGSLAADGTYFYMIEVKHGGQTYSEYKNFLELIRTEVQ